MLLPENADGASAGGARTGQRSAASQPAPTQPASPQAPSQPSPFQPPAVSIPKGGGAIRGIGEKFAANPVTGTGSLTVPIAASPGRSGFGPELSLAYDSGAGNGPFGLGWQLSLPAITRKTDKGLPRYRDADQSDFFILSGAEDLVPELEQNASGDWVRKTRDRSPGYRIDFYRPRIEGLFARIERWTDQQTGEAHWRSISRDNITTLYGRTSESRIADPEDPTRIFSWLICQSYDDKGNAIVYEYAEENSDGVDLSQVHEKNRTDLGRSANRYLKRIKYGNRTPNRDANWQATDPAQIIDWMFEVVFDYDEGHYKTVSPAGSDPVLVSASLSPTRSWPARQDPFSAYRAGFESRTYRLCRRVLMFHHFPAELVADDYLVGATHFTYDEGPIASLITAVSQSGYKRQADGAYLEKSLPPLEMAYSQAIISQEIRDVDPDSLENLPQGLDGSQYRWVDFDGEGLSGILTEQAGAWYYKPNLGDGRFAPVELVAQKPSLAALNGGRQQLLDLAGDGQLDLALLDGPTPGFYEREPVYRDQDDRWRAFRAFTDLPNLDWNDPNLRFVDLTGDGHADLLITEDNVFNWHLSLAEAGFSARESVRQALDEERGPQLVFADGSQSFYLADLSGDNLTDLARIRNGEVCYWPNLGYGRFGAKVTMDDAPRFDSSELFDQQRIRLADIDGSGTTDIIYLGHGVVDIYRNQSGNSWQPAERLSHFPDTVDLSSVTVVDLLGNGTACLVWSSPLPADGRRPMRYMDLMGGQKPHLMSATRNNMGAETRVRYAPSTWFYLQDKRDGKPWITKLPFPVHVVEQVETYDHISRNRFASRYAYHHGYFDGVEREFRGFGLVEQIDTEEFAALGDGDHFPDGDNIDRASHVPPVLTKTWFHTGAYLEGGLISRQFEGEYYREPGLSDDAFLAQLLPDTVLPPDLSPEETREAARALKGSMLRQEIYALDGTDKEPRPYTVSERSQKLKLIQPRGQNPHAVFYVCACNTLDYHYERNPADPRVSHQISLEVDDFGNVLRAAVIGYGRRQPDPARASEDQAKQGQLLVTYMENSFTNPVDQPDDYRTPLPSENRSYELTGLAFNSGSHFDFATIDNAVQAAAEIPYEAEPDGALQKRLIEHVRTLYRANNLAGPMLPGQVESLALPIESTQLAFTAGLLAQIYGNRVNETMLANEGRYAHSQGDSDWWVPSGQVFYSPGSTDSPAQELAFARDHFFLPHRFTDPFGATSLVGYDDHNLLLLETEDPLQNKVTVGERDDQGGIANRNDYRVLQPELVTGPNGNRTQAAFDTLGMVVGTAVMGKPGENLGDSLAGFDPDLPDSAIQNHIQAPLANPQTILAQATTRLVYDLHRYYRSSATTDPQPNVVYSLSRESHVSDLGPGQASKVQHSFTYSDGFGREIQSKIQAEPGPVPRRDAGGAIVVDPDGRPEMTANDVSPRWVGSGWTVFNNKGKPVRQYEPFFTGRHAYEFDVRIGVSPVLFYDPAGRVVATLHPNHSWEKVVFDHWGQQTWDVNDTVLIADPKSDPDAGDFFRRLPDGEYLPTWHSRRIAGGLGSAEQDAAVKAAAHANTPSQDYLDSLGRPFLSVADNGPRGKHETRVELDIEGNQRAVTDAKGRTVMRYGYDMLGNQVRQDSMEAGTRWGLPNVAGNAVYSWDSRDHRLRTTYDALQRPLDLFLQETGGAELLVERTVYGEGQGEAGNHRGQVFQQFDGAGRVTFEAYDFKGNLRSSTRQFAQDYKNTLDWGANPALEAGDGFTTSSEYDALNRPLAITTPDNSVTRPAYNEANLLERLDVNLRGVATPTNFVADIDYNARGQRDTIQYGNGVVTNYTYDHETFRLTNLKSGRGGDDLQNLHYAYDPAGNITGIRDLAQQTLYFANNIVEPHAGYTYDAVYQLVEATGREHIGQTAAPQTSWDDTPRFVEAIPHPNQPSAMRRYTEAYEYDEVGNFLRLVHTANNGSWNRVYHYEEASLLEPPRQSNRLSRTEVGGLSEPYSHDAHGNMTSMPHLPQLAWDYKDQFRRADLGGGGTAYYVYDAAGQRVRKVIERQNGTRHKERLYLGGFELYQEYNGAGDAVRLARETLHVMDDEERVALVETKTFESGLLPFLGGLFGSPSPLIRYQMSNHLGSAALELDDQAQIISYEEYYPYGRTSFQAGRSQAEVQLKRHRFTGKERDEESGLNYHSARYYLPWLGRWGSVDPEGLVDGVNLYEYTSNNPVVIVDSSGTQGTLFIDNEEVEKSIAEKPIPEHFRQEMLRQQAILNPPVSADPEVTLIGEGTDTGRTFNRSQVTNLPNYIDNFKTYGGYGVNPLTSTFEGIRFIYEDGTQLDVPLHAISANGVGSTPRFRAYMGKIFPVDEQRDKAVINEVNTPRIMAALQEMNLRRAIASETNLFYAQLVYQFAGAVAALGGQSQTRIPAMRFRLPKKLDYAPRIRQRAVQNPGGHDFPFSFDKKILSTKPTLLATGGKGYALRGFKNNQEYVFNIVIRDGKITHRDMVRVDKWKQRAKSFGWQGPHVDVERIPRLVD